MTARDGAVSVVDKYGLPIAPAVHKHTRNGKGPCCPRPCRCAAHKAYECQACARDRYIRVQKERGW